MSGSRPQGSDDQYASGSRDTGCVSRSNVDAARGVLPAFNRSFAQGTPDLFELLDPQVEWIPITAALEGTSYQGTEGVHQWMEEMKRDWKVFETRPEEFRELGGDRVLALGTWRAQGRGSGVELAAQHAAWLIDCRDGKVVRLQTFTDVERGLEAAGLR